MTSIAAPNTVRVSGMDLFASEIAEAERIGCRLQVANAVSRVTPGGSMVYARLTAVNARTRGAFRTAAALAGRTGDDAIEASQEVRGEEPIDVALRSVIRCALDKAHAVLT